LHIICFIK